LAQARKPTSSCVVIAIETMQVPIALLGIFLGSVTHGIASDDAECTEATTSMLQIGTRVDSGCGHLIADGCDQNANGLCSNNCRIHTHGADCYRPIPDVMAEHPGMDGYCYFNATAFWVVYNGPTPDYEEESVEGILMLRSPTYQGLNTGPLITYNFEQAGNLTTFMDSDHYNYDDLYGYSLGFLQGQGLDPAWMKNSTLFMSISEQKCNEIQARYAFAKEELVLADWLDENAVISVKTMCSAGIQPRYDNSETLQRAGYRSPGDCQPVTARDYAKHHYVKCMLGYRNSAADMAYLLSRACLLEGNHIGHFSECPYTPNVTF